MIRHDLDLGFAGAFGHGVIGVLEIDVVCITGSIIVSLAIEFGLVEDNNLSLSIDFERLAVVSRSSRLQPLSLLKFTVRTPLPSSGVTEV